MACNREGKLRLVTTKVDRVFDVANALRVTPCAGCPTQLQTARRSTRFWSSSSVTLTNSHPHDDRL